MGNSIKRSVMIRVVCALVAVILFSFVTTSNILRIERTQDRSILANAMLSQVQQAEAAHYKWSANLSNAMYAGTEFTGSLDHTSWSWRTRRSKPCGPRSSRSTRSFTPPQAWPWSSIRTAIPGRSSIIRIRS